MNLMIKDPNADLDYIVDWSAWLGSDTIASSSWTLDSGDVTLHDDTNDTTTATCFVSGGTDGTIAVLTNRIVTNNSPARTDDRSIHIKIQQK